MALGVQIASFYYVGLAVLDEIFGGYTAPSSVQIQRIQVSARVAATGGNIVFEVPGLRAACARDTGRRRKRVREDYRSRLGHRPRLQRDFGRCNATGSGGADLCHGLRAALLLNGCAIALHVFPIAGSFSPSHRRVQSCFCDRDIGRLGTVSISAHRSASGRRCLRTPSSFSRPSRHRCRPILPFRHHQVRHGLR